MREELTPIHEITFECTEEEARRRKRAGGNGKVDENGNYVRKTDEGLQDGADVVPIMDEYAQDDPDASSRTTGFKNSLGLS